jgi:serine/threonine-protein kinase
MTRASRAAVAVVVFTLLHPTQAAAQDASTLAAAQALFDEGRTLTKEGKWTAACPKFAQSQALAPSVGTLLNLGECYERTSHFASAWASFREAATYASHSGQDDRAAYAREREAKIAPKVARLTIEVPPENDVPDLEVKRAGKVVPRAELGVAIPIDSGSVDITAGARGKTPWTTVIDVQDGSKMLVTVPRLPDAPVSASAPPGTQEQPASAGGAWKRPAGIALGAAGVVGITVGTIFGLIAKSKNDDALTHCVSGNLCDETGLSLTSDAKSAAAVSTVAFVVGGAALIGGAVLFFTAPNDTTKAARLLSNGGIAW